MYDSILLSRMLVRCLAVPFARSAYPYTIFLSVIPHKSVDVAIEKCLQDYEDGAIFKNKLLSL